MDPSDVFVKTADGQNEVATRARQLPARLRSLLIMIDGKHSVGELLAHHPAAAEAHANLAALAEAGLIAAVPKPEVVALPPPASPPPAAVVPTGDLPAIKKFICTTLHDTLGPDADLFTAKIEGAGTMPVLLTHAEKMREVLRAAGGAKKADLFWEKLNAMLG